MGLRALRLSALLAAALVAGACAQQRTMVLPAADPALFDLRVPVEVTAAHAMALSDQLGLRREGASPSVPG